MTKLETSYGVFRAQNRINPRWIDFDKDLAKTHLANYGVVFVDPSYGTPIDDEYVLEECNKAYLKATTLKRSDRVVLKKGIKSTYRGKYATVVDPSIPTVKIDGKHETYALISSSQVQKVSCEVISLLDMSEGGRYLDCSFGLVWKAIKKIPNGMKLQQVKKGGCVINATPDSCIMSFLLSK